MSTPADFHRISGTDQIRQDLRAKSVRAALLTGGAGFSDFAIRLGSTAILARLIDPDHFGLVMIVMATISMAEQVRDLGLSTAIVQQKDVTHDEVTNLFWINVSVSLLIALLLCGAAPTLARYYHEPRLAAISCVLALNVVLGGLTVQHQGLLTRQLKLGHTSVVRLVSSVVSTLVAIALAWFDFGYWALVWREVARNIFLAVGMWLCLPWVPGLPSRQTNVRELLGFGANLTLANLIATVAASIDRLLIGKIWGPAAVGVYRQGYQLMASPTDQLVSPIYQVAQPGLSILQSDEARFSRFYCKILTSVCLVTMPLSVFVAIYSTEVTAFLLGPRWSEVAPLLLILSVGTFIKQAIGSAAIVLISRGDSRMHLTLTVAQNVTLVGCMVIGVRWGAKGVAIADVAATYLMFAPKLYYSFKNSPVSLSAFFATIARPVAACVFMGAMLLLLRSALDARSNLISLLVGAAVACSLFAFACVMLPGGRAELGDLIRDLDSAIRRKRTAPLKQPDAIPATP